MEVVETELILPIIHMNVRNLLIGALLFMASFSTAIGQEYEWKQVMMDGSRTGCISPSKDNVSESLGTFEGNRYVAPNGKVYKKRSSAGRTAKVVLEAQSAMSRVKDVIGYSTQEMKAEYPESALSNWFVDLVMAKTEELTGKKVHIGITNFGGIRTNLPSGEIILDDMLSMFPFRNTLVYVEHTGKQIRKFLELMAERRFEVLGGVKVVAEDGKLTYVEIDGEPLDDDKVYGLATISFLLKGGDGLSLDHNALYIKNYDNVQIIDAVLEFVHAETAAGRPIEYRKDGRVTVKSSMK